MDLYNFLGVLLQINNNHQVVKEVISQGNNLKVVNTLEEKVHQINIQQFHFLEEVKCDFINFVLFQKTKSVNFPLIWNFNIIMS